MAEVKEKVIAWRGLVEKWCNKGIVPVPPALVLAIIHLESAGNPNAVRKEPKYLQAYGNTKKIRDIVKATGLAAEDIAASYGLMQLMVPTAWGYLSAAHKGADVINVLCDPQQGIRYGIAHLSTKYKQRNGNIRLAARDYNGTGVMAEAYGRNALELYLKYQKYIEGA